MKRRGGETPRQGIRCLLPPDQIFPAAKCEGGGNESATVTPHDLCTLLRLEVHVHPNAALTLNIFAYNERSNNVALSQSNLLYRR